MVANGKSTIHDDQRAEPKSGAGTKAREENFTYDDDTYEKANKQDGPSSSPRAVPNEWHSEEQARAPSVGQHADKIWAQMQNSPRHLGTIDATRHGRPQYTGTLWSRNPSTVEDLNADESASIDRTERALLAELQRVAERRRSLRASLGVSQPTEEAIKDEEPEATVEEIMQRGKTRERLAAERAQATHLVSERQEAIAQQRAAEAEARERKMAQELELMRVNMTNMQHKESTSRDAKAAPTPVQLADAPVGTRLAVFWKGKGRRAKRQSNAPRGRGQERGPNLRLRVGVQS